MMEGFSRSLSYCINFSKFYQFRNIYFFHMKKMVHRANFLMTKKQWSKKREKQYSENFPCGIRTQCFLKLSSLYKATQEAAPIKSMAEELLGPKRQKSHNTSHVGKSTNYATRFPTFLNPKPSSHKFTKK
jgi:hypothetical protein